MLNYVGHPYYDVGIATIAAFVGKKDPQLLTPQDLEQAADFMAREYFQEPLRTAFAVAFTNNAYKQHAFRNQPKRQEDYARRVLRSYTLDESVLNERCFFTGLPAVAMAFGEKADLPLGRAFRHHIPLLTRKEAINFYPYGDRGLPVSGKAILAIQALPLGCARSSGRLLMVHSDNPSITYHFARTFLEQNLRAIQFAQATNSKELPQSHRKHRTLLIEVLLEAEDMRLEEESLFTLSAYYLRNSRSPALDIYFLPMPVVGFVRDMETAKFENAWHRIVRRAWETKPPRSGTKAREKEPFRPARNMLYEDLFSLPDNAGQFIRTYFLRTALRYARGKTSPHLNYSSAHESDLVLWAITAQFLWRILNMDQHQIEKIRVMGDRLAQYIQETDDKYVLTNFRDKRYHVFRTTLLRANSKQLSKGGKPLIEFDPYIDVFELAAGESHGGWSRARDLVFIRIMEQLYHSGWYNSPQNRQVMEGATEDQLEESQEANS